MPQSPKRFYHYPLQYSWTSIVVVFVLAISALFYARSVNNDHNRVIVAGEETNSTSPQPVADSELEKNPTEKILSDLGFQKTEITKGKYPVKSVKTFWQNDDIVFTGGRLFKIANSAINSKKIDRHAIESENIDSNSITSRIIKDGTVQSEDINQDIEFTFQTINLTEGLNITSGGATIVGNTIITGNLNPGANNTYTLGTTTNRWEDAYFGPASIHIGTNSEEGIFSYDSTNHYLNLNTNLNIQGTLNTGQGSYELYAMDQNVLTTSSPIFQGLTITGTSGILKSTLGVISGSATTTDLPEGTNLYYLDERVDDRTSSLIQNGTGISWVYDDNLGTLTPTISLSPFTTTNLAEGTNLYYLDSRARTAISETVTGLTYDNLTGIFSLTTGYVIPTNTEESNWNTAYTNRVDTWNYPLSFSSNTASLNYNATNLKLTSNALNTIQDIALTSSPTFGGLTVNGSTLITGSLSNIGDPSLYPFKVSDAINSNKKILFGYSNDRDAGVIQATLQGAPNIWKNLLLQPNGGFVGIGVDASVNPQTQLDVEYPGGGNIITFGPGRTDTTIRGVLGYSEDSNTTMWLANKFNSDSSRFGIRMKGSAEANEVFSILGNGNVGIGTIAPLAGLHIGTGGTPNIAGLNDVYFQNDLEVDGVINFGGTLTINGDIIPDSNDDHSLGDDAHRFKDIYLGAETLHIGTSTSDEGYLSYATSNNVFNLQSTGNISLQPTSGNVGIGTTSPGSYKLQVVGGGMSIQTPGDEGLSIYGHASGGAGYPSYITTISSAGNDWRFGKDSNEVGNDNFVIGNNADGAANAFFNIKTNGKVGIGTTGPGYKLEVNGNTKIGTDLYLFNTVLNPASGFTNQKGAGFNSSAGTFEIAASNSIPLTMGRFGGTGSLLNFRYAGVSLGDISTDSTYLAITGGPLLLNPISGNVGIGTTRPSTALDVNGQIRERTISSVGTSNGICYDANGVLGSCSSSIRYKKDVTDFTSGIEDVMALRPVEFTWKMNGNRDFGFVAEEANEVNPLYVFKNSQGQVEGVKYSNLTALLTKAVQQQQGILDQVQTDITNTSNILLSAQSDITGLTLKTDSNITTIQELQGSVDSNLLVIQGKLDKMDEDTNDYQDSVSSEFSKIQKQIDEMLATQNEQSALSARLGLVESKLDLLSTIITYDAVAKSAVVLGDFKVKGELEVDSLKASDKMSGKSSIKAGDTEVEIKTINAGENVKIYITVEGSNYEKVLYYDDVKEGESFKVKFDGDSVFKDIKFNWLIIK